jgi:UDP-glucose 4-epimerase
VRAAQQGASGRVFNLGHGEGHSLLQVLAQAETVTGRKAAVERRPARPFDIAKVWLDIGRAKAELGWQPKVSLERGVAMTWDFVKERLA